MKSSSDRRARHRNRSDVVDLVGREPLMLFAKVENGVTKKLSKKKRHLHFGLEFLYQQKQQFSIIGIFHILAAETPILGGGYNFKTDYS